MLILLLQLARPRAMATVTDDPLSRKVEMTNWEKVNIPYIRKTCANADQLTRAITLTTSVFLGVLERVFTARALFDRVTDRLVCAGRCQRTCPSYGHD